MSVAIKSKAYRAAQFLALALDKHYPGLRDTPLPKILARLKPARHSPDFRTVRWYGKTYHFTPAQSLIVAQLWTAWENGTPRMGAASLLEAADMVSDRIADLFKGHAAWGKLVMFSPGLYWLEEG